MSTKIIKQTFALILLGSIVLFGCKKNVYVDRYTLGEFVVENKTSVDIHIVPLMKYSDTAVKEEYYVPKNNRVKIQSMRSFGIPSVNACTIWQDSVKIVYGEKCEIIHTKFNQDLVNNIFELKGGGYKEEWGDSYMTNVFTFTEEDYQNALQQNQR